MTYKEIKTRLTKCELALKRVEQEKSSSNSIELKRSLEEKIGMLKENLTKHLKTEMNNKGTDGTVTTDDEGEAADLAKKGVNVQLTKENEGMEFSVEETRTIAKEVAKSLLAALREVGDEVSSGKIKNINPNSFDIFVQYKNNFEDEFTFDIKEDTLQLIDFSFTKPVGEVGVKPSGEAIVHKDVITANLVKHFQALNEQEYAKDIEVQADEEEEYQKLRNRQNDEMNEAPYQTAYIKVPSTDYKNAMSILDANIDPTYVKMDIVDNDGDGNVIIYFTFRDTSSDQVEDFQEDPQTFVHDAAMDLIANGIRITDTSANLHEGKQTEAELKDKWREWNKKHPLDQVDWNEYREEHEDELANESVNEFDSESMKTYGNAVKKAYGSEEDQSKVVITFKNDYEVKMNTGEGYDNDFEHFKAGEREQVYILDKNAPFQRVHVEFGDGTNAFIPKDVILIQEKSLEKGRKVDMKNHLKLKENGPMYGSQNRQYSESDEIKRIGEIDDLLMYTDNQEAFNAWDRAANTYLGRGDAQYWADLDPQELELAIDDGEDIIRKYNLEEMNEQDNDRQKYLQILDMYKKASRLDREAMKPKLEKAANQLGIKLQLNEQGEIERADLDVGHQDDEPNMLKKDIYDIAVYAAKLYKQLDKYDQMDGEVDFPHWWQGKVIKAREFMSSAQHYLEAEEKQPLIDQLALESKDTNTTESAPGYTHDCAAHVVHEQYGHGICLEGQHTLVKEGSKHVVTHYDVFFKEGSKHIKDIPVNELKVVTMTEHWHKDYKKKKKK
jgi:hypothetical protein